MFNRERIAASIVGVALAAAVASGAVAANAGNSNSKAQDDTEAAELQAIQNAKLTLADAAAAAEKETGGKAVDVSIGDENGQIAYEVEVAMNDGTTREVRIDTQTGKVLKVSTGDEDRDEDENGEHEESDDD